MSTVLIRANVVLEVSRDNWKLFICSRAMGMCMSNQISPIAQHNACPQWCHERTDWFVFQGKHKIEYLLLFLGFDGWLMNEEIDHESYGLIWHCIDILNRTPHLKQ